LRQITTQQKELTHTILLHPSYFGPRMAQYLESKLYSDVEGTCSGAFGYIIAVVSILDIGTGMVLPSSGQAEFITRYRAIVFKPFKGQVVDGVVNNVNKVSKNAMGYGEKERLKLVLSG
jgi:DNA-directed RNA polymerase II subunit RPB7